MIMIARMMPAVRMPTPDGDARIENGADDRHAFDEVRHRDLHESGEERREDEQAPHAVDDARHRGEQLDGRRDGPLEPGRAELRQEDRDAERDRDADHERDERGGQRADDGDPGAVLSRCTSQTLERDEAEGRIRGRPASRRRSSSRGCPQERSAPAAPSRGSRGGRACRSSLAESGGQERSCARRETFLRESYHPPIRFVANRVRLLLEDRLARLVLDLARPGGADRILHLCRQRHVVELDRHLVAVLERPVEELQRLGDLLGLLRGSWAPG